MVSRFNKLSRKCILMLIAPLGLLLAFLASLDRAIISISLKSRGEIGYPSIVGHPPLWRSTVSGDVGVLIVHCTNVPVFEGYKTLFNSDEGKPHSRLVRELVSTIRVTNPGLSITLVLDYLPNPDLSSMVQSIMRVSYNHTKPWREKLPSMLVSPYERTILMDADTKVCASLQSIFTSLDFADVSYVRQVLQNSTDLEGRRAETFSHSFYSGIFAYKRNTRVLKLIQTAILEDSPDQNALNAALGKVDVSSLSLPNSAFYVCRTDDVAVAVTGEVIVVHGVRATCKHVNNHTNPRFIRCKQPDAGGYVDAVFV